MSEPRYVPRDYTLDPAGFGKVEEIRWRVGTDSRSAALSRAAKVQHDYSLRIRIQARLRSAEARARARNDAITETAVDYPRESALQMLSREMKCSHSRLLRCLRGEIIMRLDDIAWAEIVLGGILGPRRPVQQKVPAHNPSQR